MTSYDKCRTTRPNDEVVKKQSRGARGVIYDEVYFIVL